MLNGQTEARKLHERLKHPIIGAGLEHELLAEDDFRDFIFTSAVRFRGEVNPDFFDGTTAEKQAAEVLAGGR